MTQHRRTFVAPVALVALALGLLGACGGSSKTPAVTKTAVNGEITVNAYDIRFDVGEIKTAPGALKVTLVNHGAMQHDFKIDGTSLLIKADAGKTETGTVTLTKGTYNFWCTVPGHKQQGMRGTVVVG